MKKKILIIILFFIIILGCIPFGINSYVKSSVKSQIVSFASINNLENIDAILVLGCKANADGPSLMLKERLDTGINIYNENGTKLLLSGDHGHFEYDEVNTMRDYTLSKNIDSTDIFMDHAGFSTYDSVYRAKAIFKCKNIIIVTQEYHLYRALYIANELGLNAVGVSADDIPYKNITIKNEIREFLARNKDFVKVIFKPESTYLGDIIPISGDGNVTVD